MKKMLRRWSAGLMAALIILTQSGGISVAMPESTPLKAEEPVDSAPEQSNTESDQALTASDEPEKKEEASKAVSDSQAPRNESNETPTPQSEAKPSPGAGESSARPSAEAEQNPESQPESKDEQRRTPRPEKAPQPESKPQVRQKTYADAQVSVIITYPDDAGIPEGAALKVQRIEETDSVYKAQYAKAQAWFEQSYDPKAIEAAKNPTDDALKAVEAPKPEAQKPTRSKADAPTQAGKTVKPKLLKLNLFDIDIVFNGQKIEPQKPIRVEMNFHGALKNPEHERIMLHYTDGTIELPKAQRLEIDAEGKAEVSFTTDSLSPYAAADYAIRELRAYDSDLSIWFDGTLGLGQADSLVKGARDIKVTSTYDYYGGYRAVTAPRQAAHAGYTPDGEQPYHEKYELRGWYDIRSGRYLKPGERFVPNREAVFYADWWLRDYNLPNAGNLVSNQPDTSDFIRTTVFDYNELFNISHGARLDEQNTSISHHEHRERWVDGKAADSFLFTNWYNQNKTAQNLRTIGFPADLSANTNMYTENNGGFTISDGLVNHHEDGILRDLFEPKDGVGKLYLGKGDKLFRYDNTRDGTEAVNKKGINFGRGYYYYDSDLNGADYNRRDGRFFVYNAPQHIVEQEHDGQVKGRSAGFMPLEKGPDIYEKTGETNYWFGMKTEVDFFLPDDVQVKQNGDSAPSTRNRGIGNKDMKFYFSGDDDVWVFVDGKKVLDLGGIHKRIAGDINFSTGIVRYENPDNPSTPLKVDRDALKGIGKGDHRLTIYYLERGSSLSNCSIYFNLAPRYRLDLTKADGDSGKLLPDTAFTVYSDERGTARTRLWKSETDYKNNIDPQSTFRTDRNGFLSMYGLIAGRTYYLRETEAPVKYPAIENKVIAVRIDPNGNATLLTQGQQPNSPASEAIKAGSEIAELSKADATTIKLKVKNFKPKTTEVSVRKAWYDLNGDPLPQNEQKPVEMTLYRKAFDGTQPQPQPDNPSGDRVPVTITSSFFTDIWDDQKHGHNTDDFWTEIGDYEKRELTVTGGKYRFTVKVNSANPSAGAGIYDVQVNGAPANRIWAGGTTHTQMSINGLWGQYPHTEATYEVANVTGPLNIHVTLIGYIDYIPGTATTSVAKILQVDTQTMAPAQPTPPGSGESPSPPSVKPADAEKVTADIDGRGIINPVTLSNGNWNYIWKNLPAYDAQGRQYYYYVEEKPLNGFDTSYSNNGIPNGEVTVSNVKQRKIIVEKRWLNTDNDQPYGGEIPDGISGNLIQKDTKTHAEKRIPFRLTRNERWRKQWNVADLGEAPGHSYVYCVEEHIDGHDFVVSYQNNEGIRDSGDKGPIVIINRPKPVSITFRKVDRDGRKLAGVRFELRAEDQQQVLAKLEAKGQNAEFGYDGLERGRTYYLFETQPLAGYSKPGRPWRIVVTKQGGITVTDGDNQPIKPTGSAGHYELINYKVYKLPSTGGPGDYGFTISGVAVMTAAILMFRYRKRKEA